jgi:hypothetical protein
MAAGVNQLDFSDFIVIAQSTTKFKCQPDGAIYNNTFYIRKLNKDIFIFKKK